MEGPNRQRIYSPPNNRPTSPPVTPGSQAQPSFPSSSKYKRGAYIFAHSPPLEHIEPMGDGHQFKYTRPLSTDFSSRPSTASGLGRNLSRESSPERYPAPDNDNGIRVTTCRVEEADFVLEEIGSESEYSSEAEIVRPDYFEEAVSEKGVLEEETHIIDKIQSLNCDDDDEDADESASEEDEQSRRYRRKKKRWSAGIFKRSHSQSVGSDSDDEDTEALDAHDVGSSARRLRRRVRGPGDRSSLIFEDLPDHHVVEVDEPDDGSFGRGPPSLPSDTEDFSLRDLPFWVLEDPMELESDSSAPASPI